MVCLVDLLQVEVGVEALSGGRLTQLMLGHDHEAHMLLVHADCHLVLQSKSNFSGAEDIGEAVCNMHGQLYNYSTICPISLRSGILPAN